MGLCLWGFSRQEYWSGLPCPPPGNLPNPGIEPRPPALQADSLPSEPLGKPMSTGVGSLTIFEGIFPTQELNQDLLHCRCVLYQLDYQGRPMSYLTQDYLQKVRFCSHITLHCTFFFFYCKVSCVYREGNGTQLQYSCLDRGAW